MAVGYVRCSQHAIDFVLRYNRSFGHRRVALNGEVTVHVDVPEDIALNSSAFYNAVLRDHVVIGSVDVEVLLDPHSLVICDCQLVSGYRLAPNQLLVGGVIARRYDQSQVAEWREQGVTAVGVGQARIMWNPVLVMDGHADTGDDVSLLGRDRAVKVRAVVVLQEYRAAHVQCSGVLIDHALDLARAYLGDEVPCLVVTDGHPRVLMF